MKKKWEVRYFVTAVASVPVYKGYGKTEAYRQATKDGWGTVYRDENNALVCDEDCSASLYTKNGGYFGISPYEEVNVKEMPKQAECAAIIHSDSCGFDFWTEDGQIRIFVTYDENGLIDSYRLEYGADVQPYDGEAEIRFEDLYQQPEEDWRETYRAEIPGTMEYQHKQEAAEVAAQAAATAGQKETWMDEAQQEAGTAAEAASEGRKAALGTPETMAGTDATEAAEGQQPTPQAGEINLGKLNAGTRPEAKERNEGRQPGGP